MSRKRIALTAAQAKQRIWDQGMTITQWANLNGFPRRDVYDVLNGVSKGRFGRAHDIAVALRTKVPEEEGSTLPPVGNPQTRQAA